MDPPQVSLVNWIDDLQYSIETLEPIDILSKFMSLTEFPGILSLKKESKIPEDFLLAVKNHNRVFFICEVSFADTVELNSQVSAFWEDADTGFSIYLDSQLIGTRKRLRSCTSEEGKYYLQEFLFAESKSLHSLCKDEKSKSLFLKLQTHHLCELVRFPPWETIPSDMTNTTTLEQAQLPLDLLFDICTMTSADAVVRCTAVCKLWYKFVRTNYLSLRRISSDRLLMAPASSYLYEAQKLNFFVLVKPALGKHPTAYLGKYNRGANTFHISEEPLWLPQISNNVGTQVIGSISGLLCVVGTQGLDLSDRVTIFNPVTKRSLYLPPFRRQYKMYANCVGGFGFVPEKKQYRLVRVVHPDKNHHQVIHTFTVGVNKQWRFNGFIPKFFGPFLANGVFVKRHLYFKDAAGKIAAYNLLTEIFDVLTSPPIDMSEEKDVRSSSLCSHRNKLAIVVSDFLKNVTSIWLLKKSARSAAATSTVWKPYLRVETSFSSSTCSLISFNSNAIIWLVDGKKIVSHKTVEVGEVGIQEELLVYSNGVIAAIAGHSLTYVDL